MSETLEEAPVDTAVETADVVDSPVDAGAETAAAVEPAAVADAAPGIDWNDIETLRTAYGVLQQHGLMGQPAAGQTQGLPEIPAPDPFADDYSEQLERYNQAQLARELAPLREFVQAQQEAQRENAIGGLLSSVAEGAKLNLDDGDHGAFRSIADSFASEGAQRFPFNGPQAAQHAAQRAAEWLSSRDKKSGEAAVAAYKASLGGVTDTEPGVTGGAMTLEPKASSYDEIIAKHVGRLNG